MCGYRAYDWNTMAMPRSDGDRAVTVWPSMAISPPETSSRPAMVRSSVDFPQPDGPTNTTNSPSAISRSIPLRTSVDPKFLVTPVSRTSAMFPARRFLLWRHRKRLQPPRNPHEAEASRGPTGTIVPHVGLVPVLSRMCRPRMSRISTPNVLVETGRADFRIQRGGLAL